MVVESANFHEGKVLNFEKCVPQNALYPPNGA
jgi:hypothetical protein